MGLDLVEKYPFAKELAETASEALGENILELVQDEQKLKQTAYTQPALLWAGYTGFAVWQSLGGPAPDIVCGHSLGEYTALVAAKVISLDDAIRMVHRRGQLMQEQVPTDKALMAAILGLSDQQVIELCNKVCATLGNNQALHAANFNAKGQVVVAGLIEALEPLQALAKEAGAKRVLPLQMSVPSHCSLMQKAADKLAEYASQISFGNAAIPVVQNIDAQTATDAKTIQEKLIAQLTSSVLWSKTLTNFTEAQAFIESGPGNVLTGLAKRALPNTTLLNIGNVESLAKAASHFGTQITADQSF